MLDTCCQLDVTNYAVRMSTNIRELVEAQVADKITKGEALAGKVAAVADAQAAVDVALKAAATARREAMAAGWTETELKRLGLVSARPTRTRKPRSVAPEQQALGDDQNNVG